MAGTYHIISPHSLKRGAILPSRNRSTRPRRRKPSYSPGRHGMQKSLSIKEGTLRRTHPEDQEQVPPQRRSLARLRFLACRATCARGRSIEPPGERRPLSLRCIDERSKRRQTSLFGPRRLLIDARYAASSRIDCARSAIFTRISTGT